jgi:6-phospho-beta-glucosidase
MVEEKIAIIGGGSAYVPGILYSFAQEGEKISGSEISLMDIDPFRLPTIQKLGARMVKEAGFNLKITSTTNLKESLDGATFVLTNFRPGGIESLKLDEEIPAKYGILGQETTGPGGTFFALRAIPQVLSLCESMEDVCPEAWLINYTNPTNFVADAVNRKSKVKCLSICTGGGNGSYYRLTEALNLKLGEVRLRCAGTNHPANWLIDLQVKGEDGLPFLRKLTTERLMKTNGKEKQYEEFRLKFWDIYGVYPVNISYLYPYFHHDEALAMYLAGDSLYNRFMRDLAIHWNNFEAMARGEKPVVLDRKMHHTAVGHGDIATQLIISLATNKQREFHLNIPNNGSIADISTESIVEVTAVVDASGARSLCLGRLPKGVLGLTQAIINWEELTVDASLAGDRELVLQALLAHPRWPLTLDKAKNLCDEMLKAQSRYLPQFNKG